MASTKPRRRRLWLVFGLMVVLLGAGSVLSLKWIGNAAAAAEQAADTTDDASDDDADADTSETGDTTEGDGDAETSGEDGKDGEEGEEEEGDEEKAVPVSIVDIERGTISSYVTSTANLVAEDEVKVLAEAEGLVAELLVEEGDFVDRGQLLAALVRDDEKIAHDKAMVRTANAKTVYDRAQRLDAEGLITKEELEKSTMEYRIAEQELAEAEWMLDKTEIRAPFSGRITERILRRGQHVRLGDELFVVTDFDPLIARIYLPESDIIGLEQDRSVRITLKANEDVSFDGRIRHISSVVDTGTGTVKVTVEAISPPASVRPGGFVTIDIVRETRPTAVLLPRVAVIRELQDTHVFVVNGDVAERRVISLGMEEDEHMEVLEGLEAGDQVIVAGQGGLKDGAKIRIIPEQTAQSDTTEEPEPSASS